MINKKIDTILKSQLWILENLIKLQPLNEILFDIDKRNSIIKEIKEELK